MSQIVVDSPPGLDRRTHGTEDVGTSVRASPPRAPLAFRVGVVGHRPDRLEHADLGVLGDTLRAVLSAVQETVQETSRIDASLYAGSTPVLRAISPLAEGVDRLFAEQALNLGFELCCVMPFSQVEFERDFDPANALEPDSLQHFRQLLGRARRETRLTQFELDGVRNDEAAAYGAAGRVVINQSDLLVVVWDGERQNKRGGTEETFEEARRAGVPAVWIDAHAPHRWRIVDGVGPLNIASGSMRQSPECQVTDAALRQTVRELLRLPEPTGRHIDDPADVRSRLSEYYAETKPAWNPAILWKLFQDVLGHQQWPNLSWTVSDFEAAVQLEWPSGVSSPIGKVVDTLRPYYAWPDKLAVISSDCYRSAFILAYLLAAAAVALALLPLGGNLEPHGWAETLCIGFELLAILSILGLVFYGRRRRWHSRWIDYRLAAELVRHVRLVAPLGGGRPFPQIPAQWAKYGRPAATWMAWYVRAVERHFGLPTVVVDERHLESCLAHLGEVLQGQITWHQSNAVRSHRLEHRLHQTGIVLLLLTLLSCGLHLLPGVVHEFHLPGWLPANLLTFVCGFFPALGAALAGIDNQAEFRRIAKRSEAMVEQLKPLQARVEELRTQVSSSQRHPARQNSVQAVALTSELARLLVNEVLDWRVVFLDRPLDPPA